MKRFAPLLAVLLALAPAVAKEDASLEYTVKGSLRVRGFHLMSNTRLDPPPVGVGDAAGPDSTQTFLDTRLRFSIRVTAYKAVSAFLAVEVGDYRFGDEGSGTAGRLGGDGIVFENKNLYLEWHPIRYSFKFRAGLYGKESDPYGLVLSNDVAGLHAEADLLGLNTIVSVDVIMALENSRNDLDGDGEVDNDYNDRNVFLASVRTTAIDGLSLEVFWIADVDNSQRSPDPADTTVTTNWLGFSGRKSMGPVEVEGVVIGAYGKRDVDGGADVVIRGLATDWRLSLELPFVTVSGHVAWASGRDPDRTTSDEAFPTVAPFYGVSAIVYQDLGGFNVTGSTLSGTAHVMLKLRATPLTDFSIELITLWAWYTSDRDVSGNVRRFDDDARDIGLETDLNLSYEIVSGLKVYARGAVLFTSHGYVVEQDTRTRGTVAQVIVGAQLSF